MPKAVKSGQVKTHVPESSLVSLVSGWVQQGIENLFATQRILVDLAMRQNTGAVNFVRERLAEPGYCPAATVSEVAGEGLANFIEGQKTLLNLVKQQYEIVTTGVKQRVGFTPAVAVTDLVQRSLDTFVEMHQDFLRIVNKETHAWLTAVKTGKTYDPEGLVEAARDSFDTFVRAQKKFLNVVTEETTNATGGGNGVVRKMKKTEITELAQQATDSFVDAQKKLIELVGKQVNVNLKAAGQTLEMIAPSANPLPEITRSGVKTFVDTEKALIDTVTKHRSETKAEVRRKRPVRPIKVHLATA